MTGTRARRRETLLNPVVVQLRYTTDQAATIEQHAQMDGQTYTLFVREVVRRALAERWTPDREPYLPLRMGGVVQKPVEVSSHERALWDAYATRVGWQLGPFIREAVLHHVETHQPHENVDGEEL